MAIDTEKHLFLRACYRQPVERTPVWIMRQAGRYLPEYRAVRKNHSFSEMYKRPDLATEVTLQPIDILGVDAAILFSDILVVPEAMGMELHFSEGKGPQFPNPLRDEAALKALRPVESNQDLGFVMESIREIRQNLRVPTVLKELTLGVSNTVRHYHRLIWRVLVRPINKQRHHGFVAKEPIREIEHTLIQSYTTP